MSKLLFLVVFLLPLNVSAISLNKSAGLNVSSSGTKTTVEVTKDSGNAKSSAPLSVSVSGGSLHDSLLVDITKKYPIQVGVTAAIAIPAVAKGVVDLIKSSKGNGLLIGGTIVCVVLECLKARDEGVEAVKKWMREAALGVDPNGSPIEKSPNWNCTGGTKSIEAGCAWSMSEFGASRGAVSSKVVNKINEGWRIQGSCLWLDAQGGQVMSGAASCGLIDATTIDSPVADADFVDKLVATPISPVEIDKIVQGNDAIATATGDNSIEIEGEQPTINDGDYTHKNDSPSTKNTNPQGEVLEKKESIDCAKASPTTLECQKTTDTQVTKPDGSVTHDVTAEAPTIEDLGLEKNTPSQPTSGGIDCKATPDLIVCSKWGVAPTAEKLPVKEVPITIDNKSLGAGTCPAPKVINLSGGQTMSFSYQPECDFATKIKPIILAFSWLAAGFIVIGGAKES
jgi:hypothetical protein